MQVKALLIANLLLLISNAVTYWYSRAILPAREAGAEVHSAAGPPELEVCSSYQFEEGRLGATGSDCPAGYAYLSVHNYSPREYGYTQENAPVRGSCCKLPHADILLPGTVTQVYSGRCPDGYVITGGTYQDYCGESCAIRCTAINAARYRLGPERPSLFWALEYRGGAHGAGTSSRIYDYLLGPSLMTSTGRVTSSIWNGDGCIGDPFGSLFVAKENAQCSGYITRQLLYRDSGKPVPMYPVCDAVYGVGGPRPRCLTEPHDPTERHDG